MLSTFISIPTVGNTITRLFSSVYNVIVCFSFRVLPQKSNTAVLQLKFLLTQTFPPFPSFYRCWSLNNYIVLQQQLNNCFWRTYFVIVSTRNSLSNKQLVGIWELDWSPPLWQWCPHQSLCVDCRQPLLQDDILALTSDDCDGVTTNKIYFWL